MFAWWQNNFAWPLILGLVAQYGGFFALFENDLPRGRPGAGAACCALGSGVNVLMCYFWAKRGGYHGAFAWFGLLSFLGPIILAATFKGTAATRDVPGFPVLPVARPARAPAGAGGEAFDRERS